MKEKLGMQQAMIKIKSLLSGGFMIDQSTVIHVSIGQQQTINLGEISIFEYSAAQSNGRIKMIFSRNESVFNKTEIGELMKRTRGVVQVTLITNQDEFTYTILLEEVKLQAGSNWELLEILGERV